jgi:GMP synthase-like glutamine amidotransferase
VADVAVLAHRGVADELGHVGDWLESRDCRIHRLWREDTPDVPSADVLVVLGSPGSVAAGHVVDWARKEVAMVAEWLRLDRPFLGVCFGAQVLSVATGGSVARMNRTRRGHTTVDSSTDFVAGRWPVWHEDAITAPESAEVLARLPWADAVFRVGRAWGVQPHIEFTSDIVERLARVIGGDDDTWRELWADLRDDDGLGRRTHALLEGLDLFAE